MKRILPLLALVALVALAGCSTGMDPSDAIEGSEAVDSAELHVVESGSFDDKTLYLNATLNESVQKNDETCTTTFNPALGTSQITCTDHWHNANVNSVTVTHNGTEMGTYQVSNGETLSAEIPMEDGTYRLYFHSENAPDTWFQVVVDTDGPTIETAGYSDTY